MSKSHPHPRAARPQAQEPSAELEGEPDKPPSAEEPSALSRGLGELSALNAIRGGLMDAGHELDTSDDCAWLALSERPGLILTTDALVEGLHFDLALDSFAQVGEQAAVVNLSDLASSGAWPLGLLWSLSLPPSIREEELRAMSEGFGRRCAEFDAPVLGGNICIRPGALELHVSALGAPLSDQGRIGRSGAQLGDGLYVSGALGSRALGYLDPSPARRALRHQWRPHLREAEGLCRWGQVNAMMDISDGLLIDLSRLLTASGVGAELSREALPHCAEAQRLAHSADELSEAALSGGEDYVLLFTSPSRPPAALGCAWIGQIVSTEGISLNGERVTPRGYLHSGALN